MNTLKVIKSLEQYYAYCDELENLNALKPITAENEDRIELLTVLIEKWDEEHHPPLANYFKVNQEAFNRLYSLDDSKVVEGTLAKSGH